MRRAMIVVQSWLLLWFLGCADHRRLSPPTCPDVDDAASVKVAGTYAYRSYYLGLSGTITFEQTNQTVTVVETTYDHANDRELTGTGNLLGNRLDMTLKPSNGDTDYSASVSFVFSNDSTMFCLLNFSDSNGDRGAVGSYDGQRR